MGIKENQDKPPTSYWLPKVHKRPYKSRFIANSSSCTTTVLSKLLTSCHTAVEKHLIRYYDTVYERDGNNYFGQLNIPIKFSINLNLKTLRPLNCLQWFFNTVYYVTSSSYHRTFIRENTQYLAFNEDCAFFTSDVYKNLQLQLWSGQKACDALV